MTGTWTEGALTWIKWLSFDDNPWLMIISLASPPLPATIAEGLHWLQVLVKESVGQQAEIVCFPESFIPGYPFGQHTENERTREKLHDALDKACAIAKEHRVAIILPMDWYEGTDFLNVAFVISASGEVLGYQAKTQLDPSEDKIWKPGKGRRLFDINGVKLGITICHEGFRYPESVRWSAYHGAQIVFHPHAGGSNTHGVVPVEWGSMDNPYYEKAMMMRALENTIFFASANYGMRYPDSASSIIAPNGTLIAHGEYGQTGVVVAELDMRQATGLLAKRFKPGNYPYDTQ